MGDEIYQSLFLMFRALQHQFTSFMEHRPELMREMNMYDDQYTGLTYQPALDLDYLNLDMDIYHDLQEGRTNQQAVDLDSDWLNQLTEIEEQTLVLGERLRRAVIKISRSQSYMSQSLKDVRNLQGRLKKLQADLRAAIETLEGRSTGRYQKRIFSNRLSVLLQKKQVTERSPLRFRSCPNIPSLLEDLEFDILRKSVSLNRTIVFKDSLEDMLEAMVKDLNCLEELCEENMMKLNFQQSPQAAGQGNKSDSSGVRETARNATSHSSDQSGQHHVNAMHMGHSEQHRDTEDDSLSEHHHSYRNNPDVSPSQDTEDDSLSEHHHSHRNNPHVSPSQDTEHDSLSEYHHSPWNNPDAAPSQRRLIIIIYSTYITRIWRRPSQDTEDDSLSEHHHSSWNNPDVATSQDTEDDSLSEHHHPSWNNPDVSPSQRLLMVLNHPINSTHRTRIQRRPSQDTEDEHRIEYHQSPRNNPDVSPSQNVSEISHSGASAQPDNESHSPEVKKVNHEKVPTTGKKTVSAESSGSPSFSLTNISTAIYKTMAASCAAILIFI